MMKQTRRWNRGLQTVTFMLCVIAAVGTTPSRAAPSSLAYEGTLENAAGEPVECSNLTNCPDGLFSFTFRLYRDEVDATPLWTETLAQVPVVRGVFRVELGLTTALTEDLLVQARTIGVAVNDGDELQPRQRLVSVPFSTLAVRADRADRADRAIAADRADQATQADRALQADRAVQSDRADQAGRADQATRADGAANADALGGVPAADFTTVDDVLDLCLTPEALGDELLAAGYVTRDELPALLLGLGYAPGTGFSGRFADLAGVPAGLNDGDDDTLAALACIDGEVAVYHQLDGAWHCQLPSSGVSEAELDAFVANNGFVSDSALATVAKSGRFADLLEVPAELADGDDDTLATLTLTCFDGQVAKRFGSVWICDDDATLNEADVDAMVANNGFARSADLAAVATTGSFGSLLNVPTGLSDGDDDTLGALSCLDGQVAKRQGNAWVCGNDIDTKLTEAEVDAFADNNGYVLDADLSLVARSGSFVDLLDVPAALADGDADTLGALTCVDGQVAKRQGNAWVCGNDIDTKLTEAEVDALVANNGFALSASLASVATSGRFSDLTGVPAELLDGDADSLAQIAGQTGNHLIFSEAIGGWISRSWPTLGGLTCVNGQVPKFSGTASAGDPAAALWVCGNDIDTKLTEAEVDAFVANNGFASSSSLAPVASSGRFSDLSEIPTAIADGDADTLGALTCVNGQVAKRQGTAWVCGNDIDTKLSEAEVDAFVANNGFAPSNEVLALQDFETHASNADAHHSATSAGIAITPASITLDGTATSLLSGRLDLGAGANDELTAAMVQTLTGGGNADALHTHAGAGGGACYTAWGVTSCATGFTASYTGTIVAPFPEAGGPPGAPICLGGTVDSRAASTRYLFAVIGTTTAASTGARGCAVCCK